MRIYIAAAYPRRLDMLVFATWLKGHGHEVVSRWIYSEQDDDELTDAEAAQVARHNIADLDLADCVIIFTEPSGTEHTRGGRHIETAKSGMAMASMWGRRIRLILVGPRETIFHHRPEFEHYPVLGLLKMQLLKEASKKKKDKK